MQTLKTISLFLTLLLFACTPSEEVASNNVSAMSSSNTQNADIIVSTQAAPTKMTTPQLTATVAKPATTQLTVTPLLATQQATPETARQEENPIAIPAAMQTFIDTLMDDLVEKKGVSRSAITVISTAEVVWSDGSLGCPQPGMAYTQALVDGYYIVLQADDTQYPYHTAGVHRFVLCENPKGKPPTREVHPDA